jgi:hypothetical protein
MQLRKATRKQACSNDAEWLPIAGYVGLYEVHFRGIVRNAKTKNILSNGLGKNGYFTVALSSKSHYIHRLVALAFIPNTHSKEMVNHEDGQKQNNHYANLSWVTRSENEKHAYRTGLKEPGLKRLPVRQLDEAGNIIREYSSATETKLYGFSDGNVLHCCNGKRTHHKGFKWAYK